MTEDNIIDKEYVDELDVGSNISVESNSTDVAGLPGVSQAMTLDLIKERYPFFTEVSGFTIEETGTDDKMNKSPSAADDPTIIYSDCLLTHIAEPKETIEITGIDSGEDNQQIVKHYRHMKNQLGLNILVLIIAQIVVKDEDIH